MKTENQKTKEEMRNQAFQILQNHHNFMTKHNERSSDYEEERILDAMIEYATLPAQSSDAVEFAEWIQLNYKKEDGYWFHNSGSSREHDIRDLYSIFLKEKGAHNG